MSRASSSLAISNLSVVFNHAAVFVLHCLQTFMVVAVIIRNSFRDSSTRSNDHSLHMLNHRAGWLIE